MNPQNTFYIFKVHHHGKETHRTVVAKFHLENGHFTLLENHGLLPPNIESMSPGEASRMVGSFARSMYFEVVSSHDLVQGYHPHLLKEVKPNGGDIRQVAASSEDPSTAPTGEFEYDRVGGEGPRQLTIHEGKAYLDGQPLSDTEVLRVKDHVKSGKAFLRTKLQKGESIFNPGMAPHEKDSLSGVGNLYAYKQHQASGAPGIHVHINLHDIGSINNEYGHGVGNDAIAAAGRGIKTVAEQLAGRSARVFRLGGDNFAVHVPSAEAAALFSRGLRQHFESIPAVRGTHGLSASIGIGDNSDNAKIGLIQAKSQKMSKKYKPGQSKTHVVMNLPSLRGSF